MKVLGQPPKKMRAEGAGAGRAASFCAHPGRRRTPAGRVRQAVPVLVPEAGSWLEDDWERLVTFYDVPESHWRHARTTNIVESPSAPVRLQTSAAKRFQKVANATALIWRVLIVAERRFRKLNTRELLAAVARGERCIDSQLVSLQPPDPDLHTY